MQMVATLQLRRGTASQDPEVENPKTDAALAQAMSIDAGNLSRVLRVQQQPGPKFVASLCLALDADLADLFEVVDGAAA